MEKEHRQKGGLDGPKLEARHKTGLIGEQELQLYAPAARRELSAKCVDVGKIG